MNDKASVCLWFDTSAEEAARFYAATLPDSSLGEIMRAPGDYPSGKKGDVLTIALTICSIPYVLLNGGSAFAPDEAYSLQIHTDSQEETDRLWNAIVANGGQESACGWCKDKWGVSWQITPRVLTSALAGTDRDAARRAFDAMMTMGKIDVAKIEAAARG